MIVDAVVAEGTKRSSSFLRKRHDGRHMPTFKICSAENDGLLLYIEENVLSDLW